MVSSDLNKFEHMEIGKEYDLELKMIDSVVTMKLDYFYFRGRMSEVVIFDDGVTIWEKDTVRTTVYITDDIKGLYVRKK